MPGLLTAVSTAMNVADVVQKLSDDKTTNTEKTKLILNTMKNGTLVKCTGDITRLLSKYVISPTIIISNSLKDSEILYDLVQLQTDIFAAYYSQAFKILTNMDGLSARDAANLLSTINITPVQAAGGVGLRLLKSPVFSKESFSGESLSDYSLDILNTHATISTEKIPLSQLPAGNPGNGKNNKSAMVANGPDNNRVQNVNQGNGGGGNNGGNKPVTNIGRDDIKIEAANKNSEIDTYAVYERQLDITTTVTVEKNGVSRQEHIVMPFTIKANIIFTPYANIENVVSPRKDDKTFWYRMNEWRAGSITFWELVTASDLIKKYKENRLRDKENILAMLNAANAKSFIKGLLNEDFREGFEQFYNMVIISSEEKELLERYMGGKMSSERAKDKFLNAASSMTLTVVDTDYEKVTIQTKDIAGTSIIPFKKLKKRKGDKDDLTEIFKALMQSRAPVFA